MTSAFSWQIDRETVETVSDFILGGSKITAEGDCSHEIKRCLLLGRKVMTNAFSWQNSISLCPASFCIPRPNLPDFLLFHSSLLWWKGHLFWVLVLEGLIGLHRTIQLHLLQHYWLGHRLGLLWYWMVCLGNEQRSFCHFWDCTQVLHVRLLLIMMATPFLIRDSCPQ